MDPSSAESIEYMEETDDEVEMEVSAAAALRFSRDPWTWSCGMSRVSSLTTLDPFAGLLNMGIVVDDEEASDSGSQSWA